MKLQNLVLLSIVGLANVACVIVPPGNTSNTTNHNYAPQQLMSSPQPAPRPIIIQQQAPAPRPIIVQQQAPQPQVIRRYVYSQTPEQPRYCPPPQPRYYPQPAPQPRYYTYPQSSSSSMYYQGRNWGFSASSGY